MIKSPAYLAALGSVATVLVLVLIAFSVAGRGTPSAGAVAGTVDTVAVDVVIDDDGDTIPDNDDSTVGAIDDCVQLANVGDTVDIDLVIVGLDPADKMAGYQVDIDYFPSIVNVINVVDFDTRGSVAPNDVTMISRINSSGGAGFLSLSDTSVPGSMTAASADGTSDAYNQVAGVQGPPLMHEPGDDTNGIDDDFDGTVDDAGEASTEGVLARITLQAVGVGLSPLTIPGPLGGPDLNSDVIITAGDGPSAGLPLAVTDAADAAISVGPQACTAATTPDVQIMGLKCGGEPEILAIKNFGTGEQDLTGWQLRSDPVSSETLALSGTIQPGQVIKVYSGAGAPAAPATPNLTWGTTERFRDADTTDFAEIVDGALTTVSTENCVQGELLQDFGGGFDPTNTEDGLATCADGVDNGGGDGADQADDNGTSSDCNEYSASLSELDTCGNTLDDGGDTVADTLDSDCHSDNLPGNPDSYDPNRAEDGAAPCAGGVDEDLDGLTDAEDPDCLTYVPASNEDAMGTCDDGVNNDSSQDDVTDADDPDCLGGVSTDGAPLDTGDSDTGPDGAGPNDPTDVTVAASIPGTIRIEETAFTSTPPAGSGLTFFGDEVSITADPGTADTPLILTFNIDETALFGAPGDTVKTFKDGVAVAACTAGGGSATPDPCVISQVAPAAGADDLVITVLSSAASVWDFGGLIPSPTPVPGITPAPVATVLPPTGQPFADSGNSLLPWLLIGIGVAIALGATAYVAYSGSRRRSSD